ncbi:TraE/TraK family type IV conjugative transfer system protein [Enterobacter sp.]|uniref:TraE/TraK family type IV conjugative transfer system protein n=1 Tax=Enterobacter sp. TaxID=42895 RepID=UPI00296F8933|nr:TraE/TraK family type IV conjugative transfer system protein [Enterobacter sp.]
MKLRIKGERDKYLRTAFIALSALSLLCVTGTVITGSLAWYFATTQKTITTPMTYNHPFSSDAKSADSTGMTMFATSFLYWRLNVSPESIDGNQKMLLGYVPAERRDALKKVLDVEAERIKKGGITTRFELHDIRIVDPGTVDMSLTLYPSTTNGSITTALDSQEKTYRLNMSYENGIINLLGFSELVPVATPH